MKIKDCFSSINPNTPELHRPYIIAEAGVNHEGSMETARRLVDEAAEVVRMLSNSRLTRLIRWLPDIRLPIGIRPKSPLFPSMSCFRSTTSFGKRKWNSSKSIVISETSSS